MSSGFVVPNQILRFAQNDIPRGLVIPRFLAYARNDILQQRLPRRIQRTLLGVTWSVVVLCHSEETAGRRENLAVCCTYFYRLIVLDRIFDRSETGM